jgi:transcriptional regulator with GAF, ATPase, and Fis domain
MIATPPTLLPADETARLHSLHSYSIVQSLQEEIFDEIVALLANLFRLPIAYVGLMEADHLSYKAAYGFPRQVARPRSGSLCALVVKYNRVVVYHDLAETPQTSLNALAIQNSLAHNVRFYAGVPLRMPDHRTIGTLCLAGQQPREFSAAEQQLLEVVAEVVSHAIAVRSHCHANSLRDNHWLEIQTQARDEVYALGALVRYLSARYGTSTPVPEEILQPVTRRLHDLRAILQEYD